MKPDVLRKQIALIKQSRAEEEESRKLTRELAGLRREKKYKTPMRVARVLGRSFQGLGILGRGLGKSLAEGARRNYAQQNKRKGKRR